MPPSVSVPGVTEACAFNDHHMCNNSRCACDCHRKVEVSPSIPASISDPNESKQCPKCLIKRPAFERFCRVCGSKLGSLQCMACSAIGEPEDKFCYQCGCPMSKDSVKVSQDNGHSHPIAPKLSPEAESINEQEVLRALQGISEELAPKPQTGGDNEKSWTLPRGSFKVTSKQPQAGREHQKGPFNPHKGS